ncbi:MAG: anaerobic ribonucleoside-triphosphate reductase activating protein [Candidatus Aenigmatarchaeota archaeon]
MKIGGLERFSLLDYPDHISAVIFTLGCNFRCPFCHNRELVESSVEAFDQDKVLDFLKKRSGQLEAVVITGGEPTLQEDLDGFIERTKEMDYLVKLDTNGTRPEVIEDLIDRELVDYVAMDVKTSPSKYNRAAGKEVDLEAIRKSIEQVKRLENYEFRLTAVPDLVDSKDIEEVGKLLKGCKNFFIQQFRPKNTLEPSFSEKESYQEKKLHSFRERMEKYVENCDVRA